MAAGREVEQPGPEAIKAVRANWRRSQILAAATKLLEQRGFHEISVNDVAVEAGISVGTVYQYLTGKEEVLLLVLRDTVEEFCRRLPEAMEGIEDPLVRLGTGFRTYCRLVEERRSLALLIYRESRTLSKGDRSEVMELELEATDLLAACIREADAKDLLLDDVDPSLIAADLVMCADMWALKHWHFARHYGVDEYADAQLRVILRALVSGRAIARYRRLLAI